MDKSASPRRTASMRALLAMQALQQAEDTGGSPTAPAADAPETAPSGSSSDSAGTATSGSSTGNSASPRIDRGVRTRTHDRITLQLNPGGDADVAGGPGAGDRGWWSPHGEPYRPLGNPELSLKLTPRLPADSPSRSKTVQDSNAKDGNGQREPSRVGAASSAAASPPPQPDSDVLDMFPRNLRKRPPEDRQARLAVRLQESIAQYSPGKLRGLRRANPITITRVGDGDREGRSGDQGGEDDEDVHTALLRLQQQHFHNNGCGVPSPAQSPRYHVEHGDTSVYMLRGAVQDGASRLRLARNGQYFLDAVPSGEAFDLAALKRHYDEAREKFIVDQETRRKLGPAARLSSKAGHDDSDDGDDADSGNHADHHGHHKQHPRAHSVAHDDHDRVYLPYTTRQRQTSPHKPLPTLAEFKAKIREERMPQRMLLSSRASMATMGSPQSAGSSSLGSPRKPSARQSLMGSLLVASGSASASSPEKLASIPQGSPAKLTRMQTRRGSVVLMGPTTTSEPRSALPGDANSDALARVVCQISNAPPSPRVHSVVRLQNTVDAMEEVKHKQSETLAKTLTLLSHDRRDCLSLKFRNLHIDSRAETDISEMRLAAEADRIDSVQLSMAKFQWYPDLLRHMLANRESPVLHPAELFCVDVIRHIASEGHAFQPEQLYRLVLLLHPEDVSVSEVQQLLTFLRRALLIPMAEWEAFFRSHGLPEPVEIFKQNEAKIKDKKRQLRMAKLRTVITLNSVLRRMTTPTTPTTPSSVQQL